MRRFLVISVPIITMVLFVLFMQSGDFLKRPFHGEVGIPQGVERILQDVHEGNWETAHDHWQKLQEDWRTTVKRVQFSSERDQIEGLDMTIVRLRGAIEAQDKSNTLQLLYQAYEHWEDLGE